MKRASRSATRNIAEGFGRFTYKENIKFCIISRGSQYELIDDLISCKEENYIEENEYQQGRNLLNKSISILNGYINYLDKAHTNSQGKANEPEEIYAESYLQINQSDSLE